jgi:shikimate kinase
MIEAAQGRTIADLWADIGEAGFRQLESETISTLETAGPTVISIGAGAVCDARNRADLKMLGTSIWLDAPAEVLVERISADPTSTTARPALSSLSPLEEVQHTSAVRGPRYASLASFRIDTANRTPSEIAQEIMTRSASQDGALG